MREHLYRAQRVDTKEWVCGVPYAEYMICGMTTAYYDDEVPMSKYTEFDYVEVIPETVCEYTGLTDKNGKKIFEGDVVRHGHRCIYSDGQYKDFYDNLPIAFSINFGGWIIGEHNILTVKNVKKYSIEVIGTIFDEGEME